VADRVVVMNQARIEQVGKPADVFHHPKSEFVMEFLGQVNVFRGRVQHGRMMIGGVAFDDPHGAGRDSRVAQVYVRPHELDLQRYRNGAPAIEARVVRINPAGAVAKVGLTTSDAQDIIVDLALDRYSELGLQLGETVFVTPRKMRVFSSPEYVI
jgi:sulfate transport system ATP-binding protein